MYWTIPERIAHTINLKATSPESIEFYRQKNIIHIMMNDTTVFNDDDILKADVADRGMFKFMWYSLYTKLLL